MPPAKKAKSSTRTTSTAATATMPVASSVPKVVPNALERLHPVGQTTTWPTPQHPPVSHLVSNPFYWYDTDQGISQPPNPKWLTNIVDALRRASMPHDIIPFSRVYCVETATGEVGKSTVRFKAGDRCPEGTSFLYLARLKCQDCPDYTFTARPDRLDSQLIAHIRGARHISNVKARVETERDRSHRTMLQPVSGNARAGPGDQIDTGKERA